jgi:hypothetical protein
MHLHIISKHSRMIPIVSPVFCIPKHWNFQSPINSFDTSFVTVAQDAVDSLSCQLFMTDNKPVCPTCDTVMEYNACYK